MKTTIIFVRYNKSLNSASFNRFHSIVKATSASFEVVGISNRATIINEDKKNIFAKLGVKYYYPNSTKKISNNVFLKISNVLISNYKSIFLIRKIIKKLNNQHYVVFLYSTNVVDFVSFYIAKQFLNYRLVTERNEFPLFVREKASLFQKFFNSKLLFTRSYKIFDGIVLMTQPLITFYGRYVSKSCTVVKVPMTIDAERFQGIKKNEKQKLIMYVGSLNQAKDGIDSLIEAFGRIHKRFPDYKLCIIGGTDLEISEKRKLVGNFEDKVIFEGSIARDLIPQNIVNASILVLPRPASKQAEGGFPTKLGEYLISGNPSIVSRVGEIPHYYAEDELIYIEPGNLEDLVDKLICVISNYDDYKKKAENIVNKTLDLFDVESQVEKLRLFFETISNKT